MIVSAIAYSTHPLPRRPPRGQSTSDFNMNRLSLSLSKKHTSKIDVDLPSNQEHYAELKNEMEDDFDYSLNLTDVENQNEQPDNFTDVISTAGDNFDDKLDIRHKLACAREGIAYSMKATNLPPFMKWQISCYPNLGDKEYEESFQTLWKEKSDEAKKEFCEASLNFLDGKISEVNGSMKKIRMDAFKQIGTTTPASGLARTELKKRMNDSKEMYDKKLMQFCTSIRSKPKPMAGKIKSTGGLKPNQKGQGKKFSPY